MAAVVALVVATTISGLLTTAVGATGAPEPSAVPGPGTIAPLTWLHVVTPPAGAADATPYLADPEAARCSSMACRRGRDAGRGLPERRRSTGYLPGRPFRLRRHLPEGLAADPPATPVRGAGRPAGLPAVGTAPGSGNDFAQMRALGFNVIRLVLNWSQLEPRPGTTAPST